VVPELARIPGAMWKGKGGELELIKVSTWQE